MGIVRGVAAGAGALCAFSVSVVARILGLSSARPWLLPVSFLLLPVGLAFALFALVLYPVVFVAGLAVGREPSATGRSMRDIAYFHTSIPPEPGGGPAGWAVAEALSLGLRARGVEAGLARSSWEGVKFPCHLRGGWPFEMEVTPMYEEKPPIWTVGLHPVGIARFFPGLWRTGHERLVGLVDSFLASDERFSLVQWDSLAELERQRSLK